MGKPYTTPTPEQMQAYTTANQQAGLPLMMGGSIATSNLGAPTATDSGGFSGFMRGVRRQMAIYIFGADAGNVLFPPQQPLAPIAQGPSQLAIGRAFDYPVGINTRVPPRNSELVNFNMLTALASYDVFAIMINRLKDKICSQQWQIVPKDSKAKPDARCQELQEFFEFPDKQNVFDDWLRQLLDQLIVYDAPAIWLQPTRGGDLYALSLLDGKTITPKINSDGRITMPEFGPGYQQVLKGLPAVDYIQPLPRGVAGPIDPSTGFELPQLLYKPRNPRVDHLYGYGPVEQVIATVQIALGREDYMAQYYRHGSTPDLIMSVPATWSPQQISAFKQNWDAVLSGNPNTRRGTQFVPDGVKLVDTKDKAFQLTDSTDEWLTRIMCFALGINPMPFIKQMNKGQEKTHHDEAAQEGLEPYLEWIAKTLTYIIALKWGYRDIAFRWKEDEETDEATRASIDVQLVTAKIYHPDEIRQRRGDEPMSPEMRAEMDLATFSATPNATVLPPEQQAEADQRAAEEADRAAAMRPQPPGDGKPAPGVAGKALGKGVERSGRSTRSARVY